MNIAIDFDGVILDSETHIKFLADCYSYFKLNKPRLTSSKLEPEDCFDWTKEETDNFYANEFHEATKRAGFVTGAKDILEKLKADGHKLIIVSKRGYYSKDELKFALPKLKKFGVKFDEVAFCIKNKLEKCEELSADIIIEDSPENAEQFLKSNIKVLFLRAKNIRKINHPNVIEVSDWFEIYKTIKEMSK